MPETSLIMQLEKQALETRKNVLKLATKTMIHVGGDLSVADVMTVLWTYKMKYDPAVPKMPDRDRFVLSKGHASLVTSLSQAAIGCYTVEEIFAEYAQDNGRFAMHSCNLINPHVEVSTGSLGHGLPIACGVAAALKMNKSPSRVYVVMGDGEINEGSMWEAFMSACQFKLGNLVGVVDKNRLSFDGKTTEIMNIDPLGERLRNFGWNVLEIDGHDIGEIIGAFEVLPPVQSDIPTMIIANTVKGKGVSFMENEPSWHAGLLDDDTYKKVVDELDAAFAAKWGV